jgi:hypothetical protein
VARPDERFAREQSEHAAKLQAREDKKATGRKPDGKPPAPPQPGPLPNDQINLIDTDSRIMRVADGDFEQAYTAQVALAAGSMLLNEQLLRIRPDRRVSVSAFGR